MTKLNTFTATYLKPSELNENFTLIPPIGSILAWAKSLTGVPSLPDGWLECDGSVISDSDSPMDGQTLPNLNGSSETTKKFLRGATTSGGAGATATHTHGSAGAGSGGGSTDAISSVSHIPPYYEVVFIMRIK